MKTINIICIIVIILILFLWTAFHFRNSGQVPHIISNQMNKISKKYDEYAMTSTELYERTVGHAKDNLTELALEKGIKKENMYRKNEKSTKISKKNYPESINNVFTLGDLYQFNMAPNTSNKQEMLETAGMYYGRALNRLQEDPTQVENPEFMIDRIEDYYDNFLVEWMLNGQPNPNLQDFAHALGGDLTNRDGFTNVRNTVIQTKLDKPKKTRPKYQNETDKEYKQNIYFDTKQVRNDAQNVHETNVVHELKNLYKHIKSRNLDEPQEQNQLEEIKNHINKSLVTDKTKSRAMKTLNTMSQKNYITSLDTTETEVLKDVWTRIKSPENEKNKDNLQETFIHSLADCIEPNWQGIDHQVCVSGRVSRVLGTLTLLDNDTEISKPVKTTEILRNEVFSKAHNIIQKELKAADIDIANAYNGVQESPSPTTQEQLINFESSLKQKIDDTLRHDYPDVKSDVLNNLISEAQQGV
jgi:hypothetical protein